MDVLEAFSDEKITAKEFSKNNGQIFFESSKSVFEIQIFKIR